MIDRDLLSYQPAVTMSNQLNRRPYMYIRYRLYTQRKKSSGFN